jgi:hypothetical protein
VGGDFLVPTATVYCTVFIVLGWQNQTNRKRRAATRSWGMLCCAKPMLSCSASACVLCSSSSSYSCLLVLRLWVIDLMELRLVAATNVKRLAIERLSGCGRCNPRLSLQRGGSRVYRAHGQDRVWGVGREFGGGSSDGSSDGDGDGDGDGLKAATALVGLCVEIQDSRYSNISTVSIKRSGAHHDNDGSVCNHASYLQPQASSSSAPSPQIAVVMVCYGCNGP